ncbi:protein D2-like isoform X1 [Diorhabda carinulata]|uniref:protein D2-like isoform X1 n=1 Tax=Diorhabda carinulata TaxID=1163345 RepID=UPI0025A1CDFF|nr:protein D2-like isoform X1 [Diorhabda carinulata]
MNSNLYMFTKYIIAFFILVPSICADDSKQLEAFKTQKVSPDVVANVPEKRLEVKFKSNKDVDFGNELTPTQVLQEPQVTYDADNKSYYTLIFTDPDAPSRTNPKAREWMHWLVVNIPGSKISEGEIINNYIGSAPPKGSGLHRYVFLLYKQPEKLKFTEPKHGPTDGNRGKFNTESFAKKYNLGSPIAGNFFQAKWDDSVPATHKKLGF